MVQASVFYYRLCFVLQPVVSEEETEDGLRSVTFDRTPIMSSYLLAFIVGEYDYVEDRDSDGVLIRVYTPVGKKEQGNFALEVRYFTAFRYRLFPSGVFDGLSYQYYQYHQYHQYHRYHRYHQYLSSSHLLVG